MFLLRILRSFTSGRTPAQKSLPEGSLACNVEDGRLWIGDQSDNPRILASKNALDIVFDRARSSFVSELISGTNVQEAIEELSSTIGVQTGISAVDDISAEFNNSKTNFNLTINSIPYSPPTSYSVMVHLDGVYQYPGKSYVVTGNQINFYEAPTTGQSIYILAIAETTEVLGLPLTDVAAGSIVPTYLDRLYLEKGGDTLSGSLGFPASTETNPSLTYNRAEGANTGVYGNESEVGISVGGQPQLFATSSGVTVTGPAFGIPVGTTATRPAGEEGLTRIDSDSEQLEFYVNGSWKAIQTGLSAAPSIEYLDDVSAAFDGTQTTFDLSIDTTPLSPSTEEDLLIFIEGINQTPLEDYTVSGSQITFTTPPNSGDEFSGIHLSASYTIGTVSDGSVTSGKLASGINFSISDGSISTPSIRFNSSPLSGLYKGSNGVNIANNGNVAAEFHHKYFKLPSVSTSNRFSTPTLGSIAFNLNENSIECWTGKWETLVTSSNPINDLTVSSLGVSNLSTETKTVGQLFTDISELTDGAYLVLDSTGSGTIKKSNNISSVVKLGVGSVRVDFTNPAPDLLYGATFSAAPASGFKKICVGEDISARTVSSTVVYFGPSNTEDGDLADYEHIVMRFKW